MTTTVLAPAAVGATLVSSTPYVRTYYPWLTGSVSTYDFGLVDSKGRKLGAKVTIINPPHADAKWSVKVQVTRNGEEFGASQGADGAATEDGAFAMASKKVSAARTRYAKALAAGKKV